MEFQRLKDEENSVKKQEWSLQRTISKINYRVHTYAIKETLTSPVITKEQISTVYATEADLLNVTLFEKQPGNPIRGTKGKISGFERRCESAPFFDRPLKAATRLHPLVIL